VVCVTSVVVCHFQFTPHCLRQRGIVLLVLAQVQSAGGSEIWEGGGTFHRIITESQNHRMVGIGSDFCESSSPTLLSKQGHLEQVNH